MKGTAAQWYTINQKSRELAGNPWPNREEFWAEVERRFRDSDPSFTARTKLEKLKQGQKLVHTYNSMFNEYLGLTRYNEAALVNAYFGGLNDNILQSIFRKDQVPEDLDGVQKATITIENLEYRLEQFTSSRHQEALIAQKKLVSQVAKPTTATPIVRSSPVPRTTGPMDLDRARKEGLCRYCGEQYMPGHLCSAKQRVQDAYKAQSRVVKTMPDAADKVSRSMDMVKVDKGKKREVADPDIGETLAHIMDTLNIFGKQFDQLELSKD